MMQREFTHLLKKLRVVLGIVFIEVAASGQGVLLNQGESYAFEFTSLSYVGPAPFGGGGLSVGLGFPNDKFDPGESLMLQYFANIPDEIPASTWTLHAGTNIFPGFSVGQFNTPWPDLQGIVKITMISGSVRWESLVIHQTLSSGVYSQIFDVPEPTVASLSIVALAVAHLMAPRKRNQIKLWLSRIIPHVSRVPLD